MRGALFVLFLALAPASASAQNLTRIDVLVVKRVEDGHAVEGDSDHAHRHA